MPGHWAIELADTSTTNKRVCVLESLVQKIDGLRWKLKLNQLQDFVLETLLTQQLEKIAWLVIFFLKLAIV